MANNEIKIGLKVDDKGNLRKTAKNAQKAGKALDNTAKSSDKYSKGQKGVAQATSNSTKAFSKMQGGMSGMVGVYAEIASRVFALSAAFQFLKSASDVTNLIAGQEALGSVSGVAYKTLTQGLKDATDGQISYQAAAKAAAIGTAAGLSPDQLNRLGKAAKNTSIALGRDLGDSFDRLVRGVTKAEPELLDELGIILRLETAKKNYADSIGLVASELNQFQQSQAVVNEVLRQGEDKFGSIADEMDDSAASLNRFLVSFDTLLNTIKMGVTGALRPVFDFLSGNTIALAASLALLGKSVLTAILPNFKDMGEASAAAMKKANMGVIEHQAHLENVQRKLKATTSAMVAQRDVATANAQAAFGKTVPTTTKGGGGALDFLMGSSDTKKSQAQADKALKTAESQLKSSLTKRTGMFKHMNAQQLAIMRASYAQRSLLIKQEELVHKGAMTGMTGHIKVLGAQAGLTFAGMRVALIGFGATAAAVGMTIMTWLGWIGVILLIGAALHALYQKLVPISKELEKAQKAADGFIATAKTLNEELGSMARVADRSGLALSKLAVQRGNMLTQANFKTRIEELRATTEALKIDNDLTIAQAEGLEETARILGNSVNPEFLKYAKLLEDNKTLTKDEAIAVIKLADNYSNLGLSVSDLPSKMKKLKDEVNALTDSTKVSNPLLNLELALSSAYKTSKVGLDAFSTAIADNAAALSKLEKEVTDFERNRAAKEKVQKKRGSNSEYGGYNSYGQEDAEVTAKEDAIMALDVSDAVLESLQNRIKLNKARSVSDAAENKIAIEDHKALEAVQKRIQANSKTIVDNKTKANKLLEDEVLNATRGLTVADRLVNLGLTKNKVEANYLDAVNKSIIAADILAGIEKDKLKLGDGVNAAANARDADTALKIAKHLLDVKKEDIRLGTAALQIEGDLLALKHERILAETELARLTREQAMAASGVDQYGFEKAKLENAGKIAVLRQKEIIAINAQTAAERALQGVGKTDETYANLFAKSEAAKSAVLSARQALHIAKNAGIMQQNEMRAEGQITKFKSENFAWSKQQQAVQEQVLKALAKGIDITPEWLETTKEIVAENAKLTREYEMQATIRDSMNAGLADGIAALIKNEEKSFKDAMLTLAESVLSAIADKLAERLAENIMDAIFGADTTAAKIKIAMNKGAATTAKAITKSSQTGAEAMGNAIETACRVGAAELAANLCTPKCPGGGEEAGAAAAAVVGAVKAVLKNSGATTHPVPDTGEGIETSWPREGNPAPDSPPMNGPEFMPTASTVAKDIETGVSAALEEDGGFFANIAEILDTTVGAVTGLFKSKGAEDAKKEKGFFQNLWDMFMNLGNWIIGLFKSKEGEEGDEGGLMSMLGDMGKWVMNLFGEKDKAEGESETGFFSKLGSFFSDFGSTIMNLFAPGSGGGGGGGGGGDFLSTAITWISSLFGAPAPAARNGGVISMGQKVQGYATGGVARGPGAGYPALLHGTEAVVPLPNGKSIPVDMPQNAGQQNNSVVVNISQDGSVSTSDSSGPDFERLGAHIAKAVQKELQTQKRSGGILSPYGVA
jgi:hypothetical protein